MNHRGFSEEAAKLMAASVRPKTSGRGYNYMVRIYMGWCESQLPPVEPFTAPISVVANFLAWAHRTRNLGQSAVASFRSAISKIHVGVDGLPIGQNTAISNLVKGVGNSDPARKSRRARYDTTWDLGPVLESLATLHPPESLSAADLSMKTLALVAMATISRASTLGMMSRCFSWAENSMEGGDPQLFVKFLPGGQEKSGSRDGIFVAPLSEDPSLDPVVYLQAYKARISGAMQESEDSSPLWVASRKPHRPVKSVTLATWMRKAMSKGGVDVTKFKAHSVRSAAPAHFRKKKALSLAQILSRGGWKPASDGSSKTFIKFYEREAKA